MTTNPITATAKQSFTRIDELDGLRGILALWVALVHIISWCGLTPHEFINLPVVAKRLWDESAQGAVDVFIILSGFVITYLLNSRPQTYRQFMIGRFFRIYPVYLICLLLGWLTIGSVSFILNHAPWHGITSFQDWASPAATAQSAHPVAHLLTHMTLLFGIIPEKIMPGASVALLGPAWSITLEWQYYLLAPFLARWIFSRTGLLLLGLVSACGFIFAHFWSGSFLPLKLPLFLVGIGSYHLHANAPRWRMSPQLVAMSVVVTLAAVISISWHWMALSIWTLVLGCLVLNTGDKQSHDLVGRWLTDLRRLLLKPALQWLGKISYPVYLVHWPVIIFLLLAILHFQPAITPLAALGTLLMTGLPCILIAAWLLHKCVEKPLMQFGKKFTR